MSTVLIVDDEKGIRAGLSTALARNGHRTLIAADLREARARIAEASTLDCALLDIRLGDGSGLDLLREIRACTRHRDLPVIVATAYDDSERTIEAMRDGAFDYLTKPFDLPRLLETVERAVKQTKQARQARAATDDGTAGVDATAAPDSSPLVGRSSAMHAVWKIIGRAASSRAPVLVKGEAGAGKRMVARAVHDYSPSAHTPFVAVRVDSATDAATLRDRLASAIPVDAGEGATLLVDGAGELMASAQAWLAGWLVETPSVRVVAHVRTTQGVAEVPLLAELYCQLAVLEIAVPPLRERRSDVPLLVARALSSTRARAVSEDAMAVLVRHDWPGNVRELFLLVRRAAEMCSGEIIDVHDLPPALVTRAATPPSRYEGLPLREAVSRLERDLVVEALRKAEGNRTLAAKLLGIPRPQLYAKLDEHGLARSRPTPS